MPFTDTDKGSFPISCYHSHRVGGVFLEYQTDWTTAKSVPSQTRGGTFYRLRHRIGGVGDQIITIIIKEQTMRTHNISTLVGEIYDKLANNTMHEMFDVDECEDIMVDEMSGVITITYQDKAFEVVVRETF